MTAKFDYSLDFTTINFRENPKLHRIGKGVQGGSPSSRTKADLFLIGVLNSGNHTTVELKFMGCFSTIYGKMILLEPIRRESFCKWESLEHIVMQIMNRCADIKKAQRKFAG